jgi:hypothetical protein
VLNEMRLSHFSLMQHPVISLVPKFSIFRAQYGNFTNTVLVKYAQSSVILHHVLLESRIEVLNNYNDDKYVCEHVQII